ncbi:unannotated protein [freshwater metagenome]|uniref:Unannotated protein n=1 Tax=freshwater metagenome TaxID=449393 RepID=A0A6J6IWG4_9ZZZZ
MSPNMLNRGEVRGWPSTTHPTLWKYPSKGTGVDTTAATPPTVSSNASEEANEPAKTKRLSPLLNTYSRRFTERTPEPTVPSKSMESSAVVSHESGMSTSSSPEARTLNDPETTP